MRILPPALHPWSVAIERRHAPPSVRGRYGYREYRQCLRWEFGFTCPFCLCHESDLAEFGVEGTGLTHVEHFVPVSQNESGTNDYANCFYICRFCNTSRSDKPTIGPQMGARLLNPCDDVWARAFVVHGDEIRPRDGRRDAVYTIAVYDLNDPRKVRMRRRRRILIRDRLNFVANGQSMRDRLLKDAARTAVPDSVHIAKLVEGRLRMAWRDLELFAAVPRDRRIPCGCGSIENCTLPRVLVEQVVDVESPIAPSY